ncbi:polyribonucleotide nucleotidyltransferase, partial [bacterium]
GKIIESIPEPRKELSPHAPRIVTLHINPHKIGDLIGSGGKVIRGIQDETNTTIAIEEDGTVFISARSPEDMEKAVKIVESITVEPQIGEVYEGTVTRITNFGAFVKITPSVEGLLHISEVAHRRIDNVEDYLKVGDKVKVKILDIDQQTGKIRLSRKALIDRSDEDAPKRHSSSSSKRRNRY